MWLNLPDPGQVRSSLRHRVWLGKDRLSNTPIPVRGRIGVEQSEISEKSPTGT